jgi:hypothetical protein
MQFALMSTTHRKSLTCGRTTIAILISGRGYSLDEHIESSHTIQGSRKPNFQLLGSLCVLT